MPLLRFFDEIGLDDRLSVGGKGANLGELSRAGIAVPPGFVIATGGFAEFLDACDRNGARRSRLEALGANDAEAIGRESAALRAHLQASALPAAMHKTIADAYARLCGGTDAPVAVRSSATSEDSDDASFAGLQDTYLWLKGAESVAHHVRACWASLYNAESIAYRRRLSMREDGLAMGVVVQRMVDARAAGVMFTRSPLTGDRSVIVIEGSYGLGSSIVSGEVTPDKFVVSKVTGEIADRAVSSKTVRHVPDAKGGVREEAVPDGERHIACITDAEIAALAEQGKRIEKHYGRPQDIEWAIARDGGIFLLQSRPETVWSRRDATPAAAPKAAAFEHVFAVFGGNR